MITVAFSFMTQMNLNACVVKITTSAGLSDQSMIILMLKVVN